MKKFEKVLMVMNVVVMAWLILSFLEVNANNQIERGTLSEWNAFQIIVTLMKGGA
jgi:cell division protein FtsL